MTFVGVSIMAGSELSLPCLQVQSPFTSQPHSSYTLLGCTGFTLPMWCDPQPKKNEAENLHVSVQGHFAYFFFFFLLHWPIYSTYYDPQTHYCLLNKIFNFHWLHLPSIPALYVLSGKEQTRAQHMFLFSHCSQAVASYTLWKWLFGYFV